MTEFKLKIIKTSITFVLATTLLTIGINAYLNNKQQKLEEEFYSELDEIFGDFDCIKVDGYYKDRKVDDSEISKINSMYSSNSIKENEWHITLAERDGYDSFTKFYIWNIYPLESPELISNKYFSEKECYKFAYNYIVKKINSAQIGNTEERRSIFDNSKKDLIFHLKNIENEYFHVYPDSSVDYLQPQILEFGTFKVEIAGKGYTYLTEFKKQAKTKDFLAYFSIGLLVILGCLFVIFYKPNNVKNEESK